VGLRNRLRNLEREVEEDLVTLVCRGCGEELKVREGIELDLITHDWVEEMRKRGGEEHGHWVTPEDALAVHGHPCGYMAFRNKRTSEPLFRWGVAREG
jgi:hypothetical protein